MCGGCCFVHRRNHDSAVPESRVRAQLLQPVHERIPVQMLSAPVLLKKGAALLLCVVLLTLLVLMAGAETFLSAFLASYGLWLVIDWYDCFVLDWVLFANIKRIRLPGTEQMDRAYHQKKYHAVRSAIGMVLGLLPCLLCGLIVMQVA